MSFPDDLSEGATFRANIRRLAGAARPFDLCVRPDQIDKAIALADLAPSASVRARPLRRARDQGPRRTSVAREDRRNREAPECRGQDLRRRRLCRPGDMDRRRHSPLCRARDRKLRLGPGRLGQRLAGLHAHGVAFDLGRGGAGHHARLLGDERERLFSANARRIWRLAA